MELFVGIDVSKSFNVACGVLATKEIILSKFRFDNSLAGASELLLLLSSLVTKHGVSRVEVGVEVTMFYHYHIMQFFASLKDASPFPVQVYALNPSMVRAFKKTYPKRGKNDAYDAYVIAERIRHGSQLPRPYEVDEMYESLQRLTRYRFHTVGSMIREKSYFINMLFLKFNTFERVNLSDIFGKTSLALLLEFHSADEVAELPLSELAEFLKEQSHNRIHTPDNLAEEIQALARNAYRLLPKMADSVNAVLRMTMGTIQSHEKAISQTDKLIEQQMEAIPCSLRSIPGFGPTLTAGIVSEVRGIERFKDDASLAKYAGLTWSENQSGDFLSDETPLNRAGNQYLRYYLVQAANQARRYVPEYASFYEKKYKEATTHHHKRALVLTARKLVRLIHALMTSGQTYKA